MKFKKTVFDPAPFLEINAPEVAYVLGLIWVDGSLGNSKNCSVSIDLVKSDMDDIINIIKKTGKWNFYERQRGNWKISSSAKTGNRNLYEFLVSMDYKIKSGASANKILDKIPSDLRQYFFRGLIDGDGCFYFNPKSNLRQFSISSTFNQDWSYFTEMLGDLYVSFSEKQRTHNNKNKKISKSSYIRITGIENIKKLGNYIYKNYEVDKIGLRRKYNKFFDIMASAEKQYKLFYFFVNK